MKATLPEKTTLPEAKPPAKNTGLALDEHTRGLLRRFLRDWVEPRWRRNTSTAPPRRARAVT